MTSADAEREQSADAEGKQVESDLDALTDLERERDEYLELAQRTKADFDNYRKRVAQEAEQAAGRGVAKLAAELVPALDNLERALSAKGEGDSLERGVQLTYDEMRATLERAGVESYSPEGEAFDPEWHEALQTRPADGVAPGQVVEVVEQGYRLDGKVLRPARVVVSE